MNSQVNVTAHAPQTQVAHERAGGARLFRPNVDIVEREDEVVLVADMPGVASEGVDIRYDSGELTLHGSVAPRGSLEQEYLLREYQTGDYFRTFRVSDKIEPTRIHAECSAGVVTVHLPKAEAAKPRRISVATA